MKRVLIISYYWPPAGGGGVMRWLKMSKYLPGWDWQPVICTPENPDPSVLDESLLREVPPDAEILKVPIWEPYDLYRKLTGKPKTTKFKAGHISEASKGSWKDKLAVFIRGNFLIPDPRVFWVKPAVRFLKAYLKEHPVDLIVSTGPPHSMHLVALKLKKSFPAIPWLADFRDPWTDIDFYHQLRLTWLADFIHHRLEKKVLTRADVVTVVSPDIKRTTEKRCGRTVHVVYNGYDPEDFENIDPMDDRYFIISHFGAFNHDRNPSALWKALSELAAEIPGFKEVLKLRLVGQTDSFIINELGQAGLSGQLEIIPHVNHKEGLKFLGQSAVLLLPLNDAPNARGILPGKMFEYLALGRTILAIGPKGSDCEEIIRQTGAGFYGNFGDKEGLKTSMVKLFTDWQTREMRTISRDIEAFSRQNLAREIIQLGFQEKE
ncbi:MAG TPA: glycosyltransferase [Prolixibacteraceae bacterium]|nr:glycosyltransferase [Prolixibacteraceae bacterium]